MKKIFTTMKKIFNVILNDPVLLLFITIAVLSFIMIFGESIMSTDYTKTIVVDDSAKIEQALSNVVNDVHSRNFMVIQVNVKQRLIDRNFIVTCSGIEKGNLLSK